MRCQHGSPRTSCWRLDSSGRDVDIVCNLRPGVSRKLHFETVLEHIGQDTSGFWSRTPQKVRGNTIQCKWKGVWVDFKASHGERYRDSACLSSDLMKVVVKGRKQCQVDAVHAFKLLCHNLHTIQHHMQAKADKFKAIALCFFAFAALDAFAALLADSNTQLVVWAVAN